MKINGKRLENNIETLSLFGKDKEGGIYRSIGSSSDLEARKWLCEQFEKLGAEIRIDAMANIFATMKGKEDILPLAIGSHHDAVPNGGKYDGAMGVLLALEVMNTLCEEKIQLRHPYQAILFTAEEPNPFGISTMGSRSITGKIKYDLLKKSKNSENGMLLSTAIKNAGGNIDNLECDQMKKNQLSAFIECHIEQSRNLENNNLPLGVVSTITGIYREKITIKGEANHSGTTSMTNRKDALTASSELILNIESIAKDYQKTEIVSTVGNLNVYPNAANIIPDKVNLIMEIRTPDESYKNDFIEKIDKVICDIENRRGVIIKREVNLNQSGVKMDSKIIKVLEKHVKTEQDKSIKLVSMAGHDAVHMTDITKVGMLFVRSKDGKSHCKEEYTKPQDIEKAGNTLINTLIELDKTLDI